ncbi:MAG: hypothetical protein HQL32_03955 [Planctomycetes bacterium]|nr:hypothetical protein [Planctomycetota bacterium]
MTIANAERFLKNLDSNHFRNELYAIDSLNSLDKFLLENDISFGSEDMEHAFNNMHTRCQTENEAEYLKQCYGLYKMLILDLNKKESLTD